MIKFIYFSKIIQASLILCFQDDDDNDDLQQEQSFKNLDVSLNRQDKEDAELLDLALTILKDPITSQNKPPSRPRTVVDRRNKYPSPTRLSPVSSERADPFSKFMLLLDILDTLF